MSGTSVKHAAQKYQRRWWTLVTITLAVIVIGLDNTVLNVAIPTLQRELEATSSELLWMIDAYIVVFAGLLLITGSLGDRFGRARILKLGLAVFAVSSLAAAYSQNAAQLIISRAVMGASAALIMTSTLSIVTDIFPREERGRAIGVWAGVSALGVFLGPVIGGVMLEHYWWGSVFVLNLPVALLTLALAFVLVPESRDPNAPPLDVPGFVLSMGAIALLVYAFIEAPTRGWTDGVVLGTLAGSLPLGIGFVLWELRTEHPMLDFSFFRNPRFSAGAAGTSLASFARLGLGFGLTQYLQFVQGYSPLEAGWRMLPLALGVFIGAGGSDRLVQRYGTNRVVATGLVILAAAIASLVWWAPDTAYWIVGAILFLLAFALGTIMAPSTDAVMGAVPEEKAGVASAINGVARMVTGAFGAAVIGSVMYTLYSDRIAGAVVGLPAQAAEAAKDSVGAAIYMAESLPSEVGAPLVEASRGAFTEAFGLSMLIGAGFALLGALVVARFMPPTHLVPETEQEVKVSAQDAAERQVVYGAGQ